MKILTVVLSFAIPAASWAQSAVSGAAPAAKSPAPPPSVEAGMASIIEFHGGVLVNMPGGGRPTVVKAAPFYLEEGDSVVTSSNGDATVRFEDGSQIELAARSTFAIQRPDESGITVLLSAGKLWAWVARHRNRGFAVRTQTAVASVRGTRFSVEATDGRTTTEVFEGAVAVSALAGGKTGALEALLLAGQRVEVAGGALGPVKNLVKPGTPASPEAKPKTKAELEKSLKASLAAARQHGDDDQAAAIDGALKKGNVKEMSSLAGSLAAAPAFSADERGKLEAAFGQKRSLGELAALPSAGVSADVARQLQVVSNKWNVNREIGLQEQQVAGHSTLSQTAAHPTASPASVQTTMTAYQQQYTQNFIQGQQAIRQASLPAAAQGPVATAPLSPAAPPQATSIQQMPAQAPVSGLQAPASPLLNANTANTYNTTNFQPAPTQTTVGGGCACVAGTICACP